MLLETVQPERSQLRAPEVHEQVRLKDPPVPELELVQPERPPRLVWELLDQSKEPQRTGHLLRRRSELTEKLDELVETVRSPLQKELPPWTSRVEDG